MKITRVGFSFSDNLIIPIISSVISAQIIFLAKKLISIENIFIDSVLLILIAMVTYLIVNKIIYKTTSERCTELNAKKVRL